MQLTRESLRDIPLDWVARLYLHSEEMPDYRQLAEHRHRQREWLMGRVTAKDAARVWLRAARRPGRPPASSTFVIRYDAEGRPFVESTTGFDPLPQISISHCAKAAVAVAGDLPLGIDIEPASSSPLDLWGQFTTSSERQMFAEFFDAQPNEFWATRLWCAKEAVGKAMGTGLGGRPRDFEATAASADGRIEICHRPTGENFTVSTDRSDTLLLAVTMHRSPAQFAPRTPDFVGRAPRP